LIGWEGSPARRAVDGRADDIALDACGLELPAGQPSVARGSLVRWSRRVCKSVSLVSVVSLRTSTQGTARRCVPTVPTRAAMPSGMAGKALPAADA
jgi:hypothetical protein